MGHPRRERPQIVILVVKDVEQATTPYRVLAGCPYGAARMKTSRLPKWTKLIVRTNSSRHASNPL